MVLQFAETSFSVFQNLLHSQHRTGGFNGQVLQCFHRPVFIDHLVDSLFDKSFSVPKLVAQHWPDFPNEFRNGHKIAGKVDYILHNFVNFLHSIQMGSSYLHCLPFHFLHSQAINQCIWNVHVSDDLFFGLQIRENRDEVEISVEFSSEYFRNVVIETDVGGNSEYGGIWELI